MHWKKLLVLSALNKLWIECLARRPGQRVTIGVKGTIHRITVPQKNDDAGNQKGRMGRHRQRGQTEL
jgi:hypothetical protein